jgi:hypothetical protein
MTKFNVKFADVDYITKKEKKDHISKMISEGWKIEYENKLYVQFKKVEEVKSEE